MVGVASGRAELPHDDEHQMRHGERLRDSSQAGEGAEHAEARDRRTRTGSKAQQARIERFHQAS